MWDDEEESAAEEEAAARHRADSPLIAGVAALHDLGAPAEPMEMLDAAIEYAERHNHSGISLEDAKAIRAALSGSREEK